MGRTATMGACYSSIQPTLLPFHHLKNPSIWLLGAPLACLWIVDNLKLQFSAVPSLAIVLLLLRVARFDFHIIDPGPVAVVHSGLSSTRRPTSISNDIDVCQFMFISPTARGRFTIKRRGRRVAPSQARILFLYSRRTSSHSGCAGLMGMVFMI